MKKQGEMSSSITEYIGGVGIKLSVTEALEKLNHKERNKVDDYKDTRMYPHINSTYYITRRPLFKCITIYFFSVKQKESECYFRSLLKIFLIRRKINVKNNIGQIVILSATNKKAHK